MSGSMSVETSLDQAQLMLRLREALEASWDQETAYDCVMEAGNPALGQCYPTARVIQHNYAQTEIVRGNVWTGQSSELHFWNVLETAGQWVHIDLTWKQFPAGSIVTEFELLERKALDDGPSAIRRCSLLIQRVQKHLDSARFSGKS